MSSPTAKFDVWFLVADTVYTGVPYQVVADWAGQGRLKGTDKLRISGGSHPWGLVQDHPLIADFLYKVSPTPTTTTNATTPAPQPPTREQTIEPIEREIEWKKSHGDENDDPDMIPLIDISLVLLIFFMMTASVAAMSPVNVPALKHAGEFSKDAEAITISIREPKVSDSNKAPIYGIRVGEKPPESDADDNLRSVPALMQRLNAKLQNISRAPEVRIACEKTLERKYVKEVTVELDRLRKKQPPLISSYGAEVNEKK